MVKLSIVITYYNTYELTENLLNVLVPQLTNEVEVTVIDDGCNETRLDKFSKYIDIIHIKENRGNPACLNTGIRKSRGRYIAFIDSDDMITEDYVKTLIEAIDNHNEDLIYLGWVDKSTGEEVLRPSNYAPWRNIYRRDIIPLFDERVRHSSDVPFRKRLKEEDKTKYYIEKILYIYNSNRVGSLTWERLEKHKNDKSNSDK